MLIGAGVRGILLVKGTVRFTVKVDGTEDMRFVVHKIKGKEIELCKKLGSKHEEYAKAA